MDLPRIQYVTHPDENFSEFSWVHRLHENGIRWIQLRVKEEDLIRRLPDKHYLASFHEIADQLRAITAALDMLLTINDVVEVALFSHADGIHIGQEDDAPAVISAQLPEGKILGGTANSFEEMHHYADVVMTYFGVGPLRLTTTKTKLKPVLGIEGYRKLIAGMNTGQIKAPVFAIGGIVPSDVAPLLEAGVYGIAISGALFNEGHRAEAIRAFVHEIENYELTAGR
jgi:thiamine-phosphate pyrophosphorylase